MHIGRLRWLVIVFDVNCNSVLSGICTVEENHVHNKLIDDDDDDGGSDRDTTWELTHHLARQSLCGLFALLFYVMDSKLLVIIEFLCNNNNVSKGIMKQCCINHMLCACPTPNSIKWVWGKKKKKKMPNEAYTQTKIVWK